VHVLISFLYFVTKLDFIDLTPCLPGIKVINKFCEMSLIVGTLFHDSVTNDDMCYQHGFFLALEVTSNMPIH
jgi:hypothetical protein